MASIADVLCAKDTLTLLTTHPNSHAVSPTFRIPAAPAVIMRAAVTADETALPPQLHAALHTLRRITRQRAPVPLHAPPLSIVEAQGMNPKKAHEVARMAAYVAALAADIPGSLHIVDVGAGQGYLTRALKARLPAAHILALDADAAQTAGAQRYERRAFADADPPIAHRTLLVEPDALLDVVDEWVVTEGERYSDARVPVVFVALHACGSLTPDVLRAVVTAHRTPRARWRPAGVVAVGCCYNLLDPADFPLSTAYLARPPLCVLPPSAFHLAAQVPATWAAPASAPGEDSAHARLAILPSAALAIRKVVWRALLERALQTAMPLDTPPPPPPSLPKSATVPAHWPRRREQREAAAASSSASDPTSAAPAVQPASPAVPADAPPAPESQPPIGTGHTLALARLGRLRDDAYVTWAGFLGIAATRMNVRFASAREEGDALEGDDDDETADEARRPLLAWAFGAGESADDGDARERACTSQESASDAEADDALDALLIGPLPRSLRARARELAALHVLRCLVGGVVEDAVLRDRVAWVRAGLRGGSEVYDADLDVDSDTVEESGATGDHALRVRLVNLFDQATGSGRNVALVVAPQCALSATS